MHFSNTCTVQKMTFVLALGHSFLKEIVYIQFINSTKASSVVKNRTQFPIFHFLTQCNPIPK